MIRFSDRRLPACRSQDTGSVHTNFFSCVLRQTDPCVWVELPCIGVIVSSKLEEHVNLAVPLHRIARRPLRIGCSRDLRKLANNNKFRWPVSVSMSPQECAAMSHCNGAPRDCNLAFPITKRIKSARSMRSIVDRVGQRKSCTAPVPPPGWSTSPHRWPARHRAWVGSSPLSSLVRSTSRSLGNMLDNATPTQAAAEQQHLLEPLALSIRSQSNEQASQIWLNHLTATRFGSA